jgi:hypothetical protein
MANSPLHELLTLLGVQRVLVVDDDFTPPAAVYTMAFEPGEGPKLVGLPELPKGEDYDEHVGKHWPEVPVAEKLKVMGEARKVAGFSDPTGDPTGLRELVGEEMSFKGMTLHEWKADREKLLGDTRRALILFDVNFGQETGDANDEAGLGPAGEVLNGAYDHIVGLLTTKVASGGVEAAASHWAPGADVDRAGLVVINKKLLGDTSDSGNIAELAEQIRTTLQASQLRKLREEVQDSLDRGLDFAAKTLSGRSPTVLEDLVFQASHDGGEWEGDTWFRLYSTLGLARARRGVAVDKTTRRAIEDVRKLLHIRSPHIDKESEALAAEIEQAESYDGADYINQAGLPIVNGDIFQTKAGQTFILVGQPCDLTLRPDGRTREPRTATLLQIKQCSDAVERAETSSYRLPAGSPVGDGEWEVRFRPEHHVSFDVLDLVSLNTDGRATIKPTKGTTLSPLLPGLQSRADAIEKTATDAGKLLAVIEELAQNKSITPTIYNKLRHSILNAGGPIKATLSAVPTPFAFDCVRVGRLSGSYADALLAAYAAAQSRIAHAHELTRIVAE